MVFKRRNPLSLLGRVRQFVWPSGGLRRTAIYVAHRIGRLPGTPYRIAAGFASGAAVSFTPFIGLHFVLAMGLSLLVRGNVIASAIGTVVGNPWTFPFIWAWIFSLGNWMLGADGVDAPAEGFTLSAIFDRPWEILWPMILGALPTASVAWFVTFLPASAAVDQYQRARRRRLRKRVRKLKLAGKAQVSRNASAMPSSSD